MESPKNFEMAKNLGDHDEISKARDLRKFEARPAGSHPKRQEIPAF